jgi:hypothetical protein
MQPVTSSGVVCFPGNIPATLAALETYTAANPRHTVPYGGVDLADWELADADINHMAAVLVTVNNGITNPGTVYGDTWVSVWSGPGEVYGDVGSVAGFFYNEYADLVNDATRIKYLWEFMWLALLQIKMLQYQVAGLTDWGSEDPIGT